MRNSKRIWKRFILFLVLLLIPVLASFAGAVGEFVVGGLAVIGGIAAAPFTGGWSLGIAAAGAGLVGNSLVSYNNNKAQAQMDALQMQMQQQQLAAQREQMRLQNQQMYINAYNSAYSNYLNSLSMETTLQGQISDTEIAIDQSEANISAFDQSLVRWQSQYDIQRNQLQMEGEANYAQLMQNWQGAELVNATRGQAGGSAALVAQSQLDQVERLAGSDLRLDENGGLFGTSLREFRLDMLAGRTELVGNMKIEKTALEKYNTALGTYQSQLATTQQAIKDAWAQAQAAANNAISYGADASLFQGVRK